MEITKVDKKKLPKTKNTNATPLWMKRKIAKIC